MRIIALYGVGNANKTTSIKGFFKKYVNEENGFSEIIDMSEAGREDIIYSAIYNGKTKVGIASQGDSKWFLKREFQMLADCDIVICSSRSKGNGRGFLKEKETETNGEIIWIEKGRIDASKENDQGPILDKLRENAVSYTVELLYAAFLGLTNE